jgi:hypothetical protein
MKAVCLLAFLVGQSAASSTLSDEEILDMGRAAWRSHCLFASKDPIVSMIKAEETYGQALYRRNEERIKLKPASNRSILRSLRRLAVDFQMNMIDVRGVVSQGKGEWNTTRSMVQADVEELVQHLLMGSGRARARWAPQAILNNMQLIEQDVKRLRKKIDNARSSEGDSKYALDALTAARQSVVEIGKLTSKLSSRESDFVLEFCNNQLEMPEFS